MENDNMKLNLAEVASRCGVTIAADWRGCDAVWPLIERIRGDGGVFVIKVDGQRTAAEDNGPYSVIVSGGGLDGDFVTAECDTLEEALSKCILVYAEKVWHAC